GDALGTMTIGDSPVEFGETPMEHLVRLLLASCHFLDPALHQRFAVTTLAPIEYLLTQFFVSPGGSAAVRRYFLQLAGATSALT
ncbi:hypothetical protein HAX54_036897, partial [Datura stramonium]|nr:hypothetical protein [Datura stramonium]